MKKSVIGLGLAGLLMIVGCSTPAQEEVVHIEEDAAPRIVADYYVGELLTLGVNLVGADLTFISSAWADYIEEVVNVGQSLEMVAALTPDLIVTMREELVAQYENIAPTILIPWGTYNPTELILVLGEKLDRVEEAQTWIANFEGQIERLAEVMPDTSYTFSIIDILGTDLVLYGEHFARAGYIIYNRLGFFGTPMAEADYIRQPDSWLVLSPEAMPNYIGDYLLMLNTEGTPESEAELTSFFTDTLIWEGLPAVQNENVFFLRSEDFWYADPISLDLQVEILMEIFNER